MSVPILTIQLDELYYLYCKDPKTVKCKNFLQIHIAERSSLCGFKSLGCSSIPKCLSSKLAHAKNAIRYI